MRLIDFLLFNFLRSHVSPSRHLGFPRSMVKRFGHVQVDSATMLTFTVCRTLFQGTKCQEMANNIHTYPQNTSIGLGIDRWIACHVLIGFYSQLTTVHM